MPNAFITPTNHLRYGIESKEKILAIEILKRLINQAINPKSIIGGIVHNTRIFTSTEIKLTLSKYINIIGKVNIVAVKVDIKSTLIIPHKVLNQSKESPFETIMMFEKLVVIKIPNVELIDNKNETFDTSRG